MTKESAKEWLPLVQALADGKEIEFCVCPNVWVGCPGFDMKESPELYRIKPTPKLRPWKYAAEVPHGCSVRIKGDDTSWWMLVNAGAAGASAFGAHRSGFRTHTDLLLHFEHSTDGGKTWKPCGVEE